MATVVVGVNSWVTIAEADTYFDAKWTADAWATLTDEQKSELLISAFRWINQQTMFSISAASTATLVKQAQLESAWYLYLFYLEHEARRALNSQGVTESEISKFREKYSGWPGFPEWIAQMLGDFIINNGAGKFATANRPLPSNQGS